MAITKILPIHTTINKSIDYICNPDKTENCAFVSYGNCFEKTAAVEFQFLLDRADNQRAPKKGNTIGRHLIQSFKPNETTPEQAHEIGRKLADEILGGKYAYVLSTHIDRNHIHNHFVWCAVDIETFHRYRSNKGTYHRIQDISDRLCKENELSVIDEKSGINFKSQYEYDQFKKGTSYKEQLRQTIDKAINTASSFDIFLYLVGTCGFEIKTTGKYLSFLPRKSERFIRSKTLGTDYTEECIRERIDKRLQAEKIADQPMKSVSKLQKQHLRTMHNLDEQKFQKSKGLTHWGKVQNIKIAARTVILLQEKGLTSLEEFDKHFDDVSTAFEQTQDSLKLMENDIKRYEELLKQLRTYGRTKEIYAKFQASKNKDKFLRTNPSAESDILLHEHTKRYFKEYVSQYGKPIPNAKQTTEKLQQLRPVRAKAYEEYKKLKQEFYELAKLKSNLESILKKDLSKNHSKEVSR